MVPFKGGRANEGHSCVKGRFAYGYATHRDRITKPMVRDRITDPWREVTWAEAIGHAASRFRDIQARHGRDAVGGIASSRCTNEEAYLVQKLVRAGLRQQQRRHLRPRLPLAHRLRPQGHGRHLGRHPGLRVRRRGRRDPGHRRQPDGRPPGVRVAHEAPPPGGRQADRRRPAPHRPRALAARRGRPPPPAPPGLQRRAPQRHGPRGGHRGPGRRGLRPRPLRRGRVRVLGALRRPRPQLARRRPRASPACPPPTSAPPRASTPRAATARSTTASASPSTARAPPP